MAGPKSAPPDEDDDAFFLTRDQLASLPPVIYGIFRYLYLIYDRKDTRSTDEILLEDYGMIGAGVTWVASVIILLAIYD